MACPEIVKLYKPSHHIRKGVSIINIIFVSQYELKHRNYN